ncbi:hypothetical protein R3P38DRAFT_3269974 [Favolaschia claudopus]|uniref:Uncharacterized protein n=1 Tax=Favolaschia claudopus TaxID=2862362 RepID=A0AAW0BHM6_9AGAR
MWRLNKPSSLRAFPPLLLLLSCLVGESTRDGQRPISPPLRLIVELLQIAVSLMLYIVVQRKHSNWILLSEPEKDEDPGLDARQSSNTPIPTGSSRFYALGGIIGALFAVQAFTSFKLARLIGIVSGLIVMLASHTYQPAKSIKPGPSIQQLLRFEAAHPNCHPRKEPATLRPVWESDYHKFDNVLLVVFLSHARYDIVYIGTGNREDAGFEHSFDVVANSYHSSEDINADYFKLSGRMAHHMLWQVMMENDCGYDGYLWAPFDTFLNVPRLQQFDKARFWYSSPWAQYVPNPALHIVNKSREHEHHPRPLAPAPAEIAPLVYPDNPDDIPKDKDTWWWHSHRAASLSPGIREGGSADTIYIPQRYAKAYRDTLAVFLETTCFLVIVMPATVHLVNPRHEPSLFVDHHWLAWGLMNATWVREQWENGLEVDTFHTFHWGSGHAEMFKMREGIVEDTRLVLTRSAARQGIEWE